MTTHAKVSCSFRRPRDLQARSECHSLSSGWLAVSEDVERQLGPCASSSRCPSPGWSSSSCCRSPWCWRSRFGTNAPDSAPPVALGLSLESFKLLFTDDLYVAAWLSSLRIAATATLACLLLGYPMAYAIARAAPAAAAAAADAGHPAVLDVVPDPRLRLDRAAGRERHPQPVPALDRPRLRSRHDPGHRMGGAARHRLRLPALHGAAALRLAGEARYEPARGGGRSRRQDRSPPSSPSPCRCRCPASSRAACWCSSRRSASS